MGVGGWANVRFRPPPFRGGAVGLCAPGRLPCGVRATHNQGTRKHKVLLNPWILFFGSNGSMKVRF